MPRLLSHYAAIRWLFIIFAFILFSPPYAPRHAAASLRRHCCAPVFARCRRRRRHFAAAAAAALRRAAAIEPRHFHFRHYAMMRAMRFWPFILMPLDYFAPPSL